MADEFQYPLAEDHIDVLHQELRVDPIDTIRIKLDELRKPPNIKIGSPADIFQVAKEMQDYDRERVKVIHLDMKNMVLAIENVSEGSIGDAIVHPREVFKGSLLTNAAAIAMIHNHPSGDPQPSTEDMQIAARLQKAGEILGVPLLDFVIIGVNRYISLKEERLPPFGSMVHRHLE